MRDDFAIVIMLLITILVCLVLIGEAIYRELTRRPRVIRVFEGGKREHDEPPENLASAF